MLKFLVRGISWKSFAMGAAASVMGGAVLHPVLVTVAKVGMGAASVAQDAWNEASAQIVRVRDEAAQSRTSASAVDAVLKELKALRSDVAAVKAKVGIA